jgi:hypothetical protein
VVGRQPKRIGPLAVSSRIAMAAMRSESVTESPLLLRCGLRGLIREWTLSCPPGDRSAPLRGLIFRATP